MANVQKYTRKDISGGSLTRHYERAMDGEGNYHQWGNQEIDPSRSHLNYNLAPERDGGQLTFIEKRLADVKCHKRDDVNVMCSWVITAPKNLTENEYDLFFQEVYNFLNDKYGQGSDNNVISAYVHMDETSPHLHYAFIPVVNDKKTGREKVSAKEALGWSERGLNKFHGELETHMTTVFGREVGILNDATREGNKTIDELKRGTAQAKLMELEKHIINERNELADVMTEHTALSLELPKLNAKKEKLETDVSKLTEAENRLSTIKGNILTEEKITKIQTRLTNMSKIPGMHESRKEIILSERDYSSLSKTAIHGTRNIEQEKRSRARENDLDEREARINRCEISLKNREGRVSDDESGLAAQRKKVEYWIGRANMFETNYNRVLKELNQLKAISKKREQER
jgi:hypothetical protein